MAADAMDHDGADLLGQRAEDILDLQNDAVIERIALGRAIEAHQQHPAAGFDLEQGSRLGHRHRIRTEKNNYRL